MKHGILLVLILLLPQISTTLAQAKPRAVQEDDIREVLFRHLAPDDKTSKSIPHPLTPSELKLPELKLYFFSYSNPFAHGDPSPAFMKRFAKYKPSVKPESASYDDPKAKEPGWSCIKDKATHEPGIRFSVGRIEWLSQNRVKVGAGYFAGLVNAAQAVYWLKFSNGHWRIIKTTDSLVF